MKAQKVARFLIFFSIALTYNSLAQNVIITGTVKDNFGFLPGAKIEIEGTTLNTYSDVSGRYILKSNSGEQSIRASFIMYIPQSQTINIKEGDTLNLDFVLAQSFAIEQEITVGSRAKPKSAIETSLPIDVITPDEISNSPQNELGQILHYVSPTFNSTHQTIADGTDHVDPATLRGLGPDQILVLVNGKRRHSSSLLNVNGTLGRGTVGTDFNAIPISAIDRIEILRDGAAAQYGSDAIAGVVNIILKENTNSINLDVRQGVNMAGDGYSSLYGSNMGFQIGNGGYINFSAEFRQRNATNRAGNYTGEKYPLNTSVDTTNFFNYNNYEGQRVMEIGNAASRNTSIFFNIKYPLQESVNLYSHGGRNIRHSEAHAFYRFPKDQNRVISSIYPHGFSPELATDITDNAITVGIQAERNGWNIDLSNTSGSNEFDFQVSNSNNASMGDKSPTSFFAGGFDYGQNTTNIDINKNFEILEGLSLAFGGEFREDNYKIIAGELASWLDGGEEIIDGNDTIRMNPGSQGFPGFQPDNELSKSRTNNAGYIDIETRITSKWLVDLAFRIESYSDFGDQSTYKLSSRYQILPWMSFRAGYSTGFRAPSLHQLYFNSVSTQFVGGEAVSVATINNENPVTRAFGIETLKPELSKHGNAGLSMILKDYLSISLDYYYIFIADRIVLSGRFSNGYEAILNPIGVNEAQFMTNAIDTKTQGLDVRLVFRKKIGLGSFKALIGLNYSKTIVQGAIKTSNALLGQEETLFNREEVSRIESIQPNTKGTVSLSYLLKNLTLELRNTYFGSVEYVHPNDGETSDKWAFNELSNQVESRDQTFSPKIITDAVIAYDINPLVRIRVGGNNIFNVYPDKHTHSENINSGNFVYSRRVQQFGVKGAYYFIGLQFSL